MAKKKGQRMMVGLLCSVCNCMNYVTERNKTNTIFLQSGMCTQCHNTDFAALSDHLLGQGDDTYHDTTWP